MPGSVLSSHWSVRCDIQLVTLRLIQLIWVCCMDPAAFLGCAHLSSVLLLSWWMRSAFKAMVIWRL